VGKGHVPVRNVVKEVDFLLLQHETRGNGMDRSVTPALVEETAVLVEGLEVVEVLTRAKPAKAANLEVGPLQIDDMSVT